MSRRIVHTGLLLLALAAAGAVAGPALAQRGGGGGDAFRFRFVGPTQGNRVASVAGVPGDMTTYYAGAASGGVWKSTDGGNHWDPIFDNEPVAAIGALAVSPSDPNIVWAGTGEAWAIRDIDVMGDGVYKSTDAGKTWTHMGLVETGRIGRMIVIPTNPDIVYVCAAGRLTGPQQERGVYHTTDGGKTWARSLFVDPNTGCSGLTMDAKDPNTLFAGTWQVVMHTYGEFSGGPGSGVYHLARRRHDLEAAWKATACPHSPVGKIDVAIAPTEFQARLRADPDRRAGLHLALGRRRRELEADELGSRADRARRLLHPASRSRRATRTRCWSPTAASTSPPTAAETFARSSRGAATTTTSGWIRRIPIASSSRTTAAWTITTRRTRTRRAAQGHAADRPDVPRRGGRPDPVLLLRQHAGRQHHARAERAVRRDRRFGMGARPAGTTAWAAANPASPCPIRPIRTSSGPPATATKSPAGTPRPSWRDRSVRGCTRSIRRPTRPSTAATGRRRWRSIRSITTPCITAAR